MARKGKQKGELSKKQMRSITTLDAVVNATKRMARARNVDIDFYGQEYKQYFADFVRILRDDKTLSDDECLKILNDDFLKNVNGGILPHTKQRSLSQAYTIYKNAVAYAETQIKKEYGADNYYDLGRSKDPKAREAFEKFEAWQKMKDAEFEQIADVTEEMLAIQRSANPLKELSQTGVVLGPLLIGLGVAGATSVGGLFATSYIAEKLLDRDKETQDAAAVAGLALSILGGAGLCVVVYYTLAPSGSALQLDLKDFAKEYGFSNEAELINAINNSFFQYLTPEEAKTVYASMQDAINEGIATQYNLDSYEQALQVIENAKSTELVSKDEILQDIANERALALDTVARQNGFSNYQELLQYLQQHKVEAIDRLRHPIDAYDSQTPKALSSLVDNVQEFYNAKVTEINSINWPRTMEVIDDETVKNMAMQFSANEAVLNSAYENLIIDDANVFYSPDIATQIMGVDTLEVTNKHGVDTIKDTVDPVNIFGDSKDSAMDTADTDLDIDADGLTDAIGNAVQTMDVSALDAVAGVGVGAGLTVALKNSKLIKDSAKMHRSSKLLKKLREIDKQSEQDMNR